MKTKKFYAEQAIIGLQNDYPNIDFKITLQEVYIIIDNVVNAMAKDNYFENWKLYGAAIDEAFVTTWDGDNALTVVDPDELPSYIVFPANYVALPKHAGINEVWPINYEYGSVRIMDHGDVRRTRKLMSGNLQNELGGYPKGSVFEFNQVGVGKNFSETFGMRLVVHDSSLIAIDVPYPIPADMEDEVIRRVKITLQQKRLSPTDTVRDKNDKV